MQQRSVQTSARRDIKARLSYASGHAPPGARLAHEKLFVVHACGVALGQRKWKTRSQKVCLAKISAAIYFTHHTLVACHGLRRRALRCRTTWMSSMRWQTSSTPACWVVSKASGRGGLMVLSFAHKFSESPVHDSVLPWPRLYVATMIDCIVLIVHSYCAFSMLTHTAPNAETYSAAGILGRSRQHGIATPTKMSEKWRLKDLMNSLRYSFHAS